MFGTLFISDVLKKPVYDPKGEIAGRVKDVIIVKKDPLPRVSAIVTGLKGKISKIMWEDINIFSKKIISTYLTTESLPPYALSNEDLLALRDILDKQVIDANGVKVVRVNDIKLEGYKNDGILSAVDVGMGGIVRRLGAERFSERLFSLFGTSLPDQLISWEYIQPLNPRLDKITLTVTRQMISNLHPADIAEMISQVPRDEGDHLFKDLDLETAAEALSELEPDIQTRIISSMEPGKAADIIEEMPPDEAADVLGDLSAKKFHEIFEHIEKEEAEDIKELMVHEDDTAGGMMTNEFIAYTADVTVREAIERFRNDAVDVKIIYYVYIIDKEEKLAGVISLRELLMADPSMKLGDVMETNIQTETPDTSERAVAELAAKYDLVALPIVDEEGVLLGIVTIDDIIDRVIPFATRKGSRKI
ncbi:MAG: magnesium transporter [Nitrospirae bacterium]|nr:magnesium transporter [Nitrospirota bacterium]